MGKNTDKLYITPSEWAKGSSSFSPREEVANDAAFWTCSISQQTTNSPVCDSNGIVFDLRNILIYLRKNDNKSPIDGSTLKSDDLIKLKLAKNAEGRYIDPVTFQEFATDSDAVVIKPSARVYLRSTIINHNAKLNLMEDLISGERFTEQDIITLKGGVGARESSLSRQENQKLIELPTQSSPNTSVVKTNDDPYLARKVKKSPPVGAYLVKPVYPKTVGPTQKVSKIETKDSNFESW